MKNMRPQITIITPVYNGSKFLRPFMDSILAQDYFGYCMICIDDGSDDSTFEILQGYAREDDRILLYQNVERKGAAYSRNLGLTAAGTEYVIFLDADDVVEANLLSSFYQSIQENNVDIAFCERDRFEGDVSNIITQSWDAKYIESNFSKKFRLLNIDVEHAIKLQGAPAAYIYRREFIQKNKLRFQDLTSSNDTYFVEMAKILANEIVHVRETKALIHQRQHNQISRISFHRDPMNVYKAIIAVKEKLEELGLCEKARKYYLCRIQVLLAQAIKNTKKEEEKVQFLEFLRGGGFAQLGINECIFSGDDLRRVRKYIWRLLLNGTIQEIEQIELFEIGIRANVERIERLFEKWKNRKIAFWGIGYRWEKLYQWCKHTLCMTFFLVDAHRRGKLWHDIEIFDCREIAAQIDMVIVLNDAHLDDIVRQIQEWNIKLPIFSLDKYIMMEMQAEECWRELS